MCRKEERKEKIMKVAKPRIGWVEKRSNANSDGAVWVKCKVCGDEKLAWKSSLSEDDFVCKNCSAKVEEIVSMRCFRHKKRFNVPRWWMDISKWLCPSCFERLSEEERERYVTKGREPIYRVAEVGKPILKPKKELSTIKKVEAPIKKEYVEYKISTNKSEEGRPSKEACVEETHKVERQEIIEKHSPKIGKTEECNPISSNPAFAGLLPRYKVTCQQCGDTVPCHYSWFEKSTVLCPSCYCGMSEQERTRFHELHKAAEVPKWKEECPIQKPCEDFHTNVTTECGKWVMDSRLLTSGGFWSSKLIMTAPKWKLKDAARRGLISKARLRIELRRRNDSEYYNMLPQNPGEGPILQ